MTAAIELNLTTASSTSTEIEINELNANYREYCLKDSSGTPWAAGATVYLERKLSEITGWIRVLVAPTSSTQFAQNYDGAGIGLDTMARVGKIRFVLVGGDGSTDVKITIA